MSRKTLILVVLLALAVSLGAFWLGMRIGTRGAEPATAVSRLAGSSRAVPPSLPDTAAPARSPGQMTPPWATPGGPASMPGMPENAARIERQKQIAELRTMQMALMKSIQENQRADPRQVDALLVKIKEVTGRSTVGGVDIEALRKHLARAEEMQRIALEMNQEASRPGGADPKKIKAYADQLLALQQKNLATPAFQLTPPPGPSK